MDETSHPPLNRRRFMEIAVSIGGVSAFSACLSREESDTPTGIKPSESRDAHLPNRQHAWNDFSETDGHGNVINARHHVILLFNYDSKGLPTSTEQEELESAFRVLEHAFEWSSDGLLFTVAYSPYYFDKYDADLPDSVDLTKPKSLAPFEDPELDDPDIAIHLASNTASNVLGAEEALLGNIDTLNGAPVDHTTEDILTVYDRRTGFVGAGLPAAHDTEANGVPDNAVDEDAPLFMGFKSGFEKNQAPEDKVTIETGPFADGTTQHISKLRQNLHQWYEQDPRPRRVALMFCPAHRDEELVEGVGNNLGNTDMVEEKGCAERTEQDASERGIVGHSQKLARVRDEDGNPLILRRDFDTIDGGHAGLHFLSVQQTIDDFEVTREAMNGTDVAGTGAVGTRNNNGILQYIETLKRGNYLIPPREHRSFPSPRP